MMVAIYHIPMLFPYKHKIRFIYEENIFLNRKQICQMLNISSSSLSKHLKHILHIPGCISEKFRTPLNSGRYRHATITHYNLNTVIALAYRINNDACRRFLDSYHRAIHSLHMRISGANYYIPTTITETEFKYYAQKYCYPYQLNHEDS